MALEIFQHLLRQKTRFLSLIITLFSYTAEICIEYYIGMTVVSLL